MTEKLTEAFISLFVVIEPFGLVPIFLMYAKVREHLSIIMKHSLIFPIIS